MIFAQTMAKKDNKKKDTPGSLISKETRNAIIGVLSLLLAILLFFAAFGGGGPVGGLLYRGLSYLFGIGYYLVPPVFLILSISFFRSREKTFALPKSLGALLFFVSSLGLVNIAAPSRGGVVGGLISAPLLSLFAPSLSVIILLALIIISLLVIFDTSIKIDFLNLIKKIFKRKEKGANEE